MQSDPADALGDDEAAYRALLRAPGADAAELAEALGGDVEETAAALGRLVSLGLAHRSADGRHLPSPPKLVLGPMLDRLHERLRHSETLVADLTETYLRESARVGMGQLVEVVDGAAAVGQRLMQLEYGARRTIRAFQSGHNRVSPVPGTIPGEPSGTDDAGAAVGDAPAVAAADDPETVRTQARPGVRYRVVVDSAFLQEPAAVRALHRRLEEGAEVRVVDEQLRKLAVFDDEIALVQTADATAVMLHGPVAALAVDLFETTWRTARAYLADVPDLELVDRQLLQLMLAGLTDQALATQLGTSARTVQRRIRVLMDATGSASRMQLAWQAARRGWV